MVRFIPQFKDSAPEDKNSANNSVPPESKPERVLPASDNSLANLYNPGTPDSHPLGTIANLYQPNLNPSNLDQSPPSRPDVDQSNLNQSNLDQPIGSNQKSKGRKSLLPWLWGGTQVGLQTVGGVLGFRLLRGRWRWYILSTLILGAGGVAGAGYWAWLEVDSSVPSVQLRERMMNYTRSGSLTIKASDGHIIHQSGPVTHEQKKISEMPPRLAQAFIAIEDRRFREHDGVDYQGIVRAVVANIESGKVVEGGSTITQQLARIVFLDQEHTYWRKLRESRLAQKIESQATKDDILERYLNLVYLGSGAYGVADASWVYFSKPLNKLTLAEIATIAGLAPAPTEYSPLVNKDIAKKRRNLVLQQMAESGFITAAEARESIASPLETKPSPHKAATQEASYFVDYIKTELPKHVTPETFANGGLIVETTINRTWQQAAEKVIQETVAQDGQPDGFSQAALVAIDPRNGEVKAMVGGTDYQTQKFNRATQAQRQPGSTFKGLLYTAAIAAGFSPNKAYVDAELTLDDYKPKNYGGTFRGTVSMRDALTSSLNIVAIKVLLDVGWNPLITLAKKMGIESELAPTYSLALGSSEVNLLEITSAYGTLANKGLHQPPHGIRRILDQSGKIIYDAPGNPKVAVDPDTAAIMTWMLQAVVESGTGTAAILPDRPVAGKTGTSDQARDLWFIGYIPQIVAGVWMGNDDNGQTWGASSAAARAWNMFMTTVIKDVKPEAFPPLPPLEREATIKVEPIRPNRMNAPGGSGERTPEGRNGRNESVDNPSGGSSSRDAGGSSGAYTRGSESSAPEANPGERNSAPANPAGVPATPVPEVTSSSPEPAAPLPIPAAPEPVAPMPEPAAPAPAEAPAATPKP